MKNTTAFLLFCAICCSALATGKPASEKQCQQWQQQLDKVNTELRSGYKTERGNTLRKRRHKLQSKLHSRCK